MANPTKTLTKQDGEKLMRLIDSHTSTVLWKEGFEAFRFDCDVHDVEGFLMLKIKIRPLGGEKTMTSEQVAPEAEWATRCKTCGRSKHFILCKSAENDLVVHRREYPDHDVRLISIPLD